MHYINIYIYNIRFYTHSIYNVYLHYSVSLYVSLSISLCLSLRLSFYVSLYLSMPLCLSLCLSLSISLSTSLSVYVSLSLYLFVSLSFPFCLSLYLFVSLSLSHYSRLSWSHSLRSTSGRLQTRSSPPCDRRTSVASWRRSFGRQSPPRRIQRPSPIAQALKQLPASGIS